MGPPEAVRPKNKDAHVRHLARPPMGGSRTTQGMSSEGSQSRASVATSRRHRRRVISEPAFGMAVSARGILLRRDVWISRVEAPLLLPRSPEVASSPPVVRSVLDQVAGVPDHRLWSSHGNAVTFRVPYPTSAVLDDHDEHSGSLEREHRERLVDRVLMRPLDVRVEGQHATILAAWRGRVAGSGLRSSWHHPEPVGDLDRCQPLLPTQVHDLAHHRRRSPVRLDLATAEARRVDDYSERGRSWQWTASHTITFVDGTAFAVPLFGEVRDAQHEQAVTRFMSEMLARQR